ncbi:MAG: discoidin domain-containing protein [Pirellulales bacterium]
MGNVAIINSANARRALLPILVLLIGQLTLSGSSAQVLDKQKLLAGETFWDNRDWDWYQENIPFFECPDADIQTTYYYRWELLTKHLTYGSPTSGYTFTEFIDRPFWSGTYGAISCPAGHQLYEARWLRRPRIPRDFARYWFRTPGAEPRRYSCWLADAVWALHEAHPDRSFMVDLLPDLVKNYEGWEQRHFDANVGLFWQTGHDDGMEININSRQTQDTVRGAPGYRPTLNSYLWADALAIARVADLAGDMQTAARYREKAAALKRNVQKKLWDQGRQFFFHMNKNDEERDGHKVAAHRLTYETGQYAGSPHGLELIGYVPWQFNLLDAGYESAWKFLMDRDYFFADFGPTTVGRRDPMFSISNRCCVWSGQSWPYATTQTLKAMANLLQNYKQGVVAREDYYRLLSIYAKTHRKDGRPYLAEAAHPDTGSWEGHDAYNHSEHYFHSGYVDLIITGLVGLRPRGDDTVEVHPLAPADWDYFALDGVVYHGRELMIFWDKEGKRYGRGAGLHVIVDGRKIASAEKLQPLTANLPGGTDKRSRRPLVSGPKNSESVPRCNFAVNNDGAYYPRIIASHTAEKTSAMKLIDGAYWYHLHPPNRWTNAGSTSGSDWLVLDFGIPRRIHEVVVYPLDDGELSAVRAPWRVTVQRWDGKGWLPIQNVEQQPRQPTARRANRIRFKPIETTQLRVVLRRAPAGQLNVADGSTASFGLTELETWGESAWPLPMPAEPTSLATNRAGKDFPKAEASFTSRFDRVAMANDGKTNFNAAPHNRWTSFESRHETDWLAIDFGAPKRVGRVELAIYDDGGGVQAPADYKLEYFDGKDWRPVNNPRRLPERPIGGQYNELRFEPVNTAKIRVIFTHQGKSRSGLSEILAWPE